MDDKTGRIRSSRAVTLLAAALLVSLVLGVGLLLVNSSGESVRQPALSDEQAAAQVLESAKRIVAVARLDGVAGGYRFMSCTNERDPPYQVAMHLTFRLPHQNSVSYLDEVAAAMVADGWHEAPAMAQHFGKKLTKDGVTSVFYRDPRHREVATMRLYGECRAMADHRNDNPAWTEVTDRLRS
ncbi:hypothetical protein [Mycobacterium hubeiense]|uniref:hypothetical protein n=1 Tax=Mycobacterium hubeiense TaxID=1867256 RepID=UPI000C7EA966|nr:hypothetical protein [Mycobacterium sp. QGD 101]